MRILQVNKFYYPHGGADKYFLQLCSALKDSGEEVAVFSMDHPKNLPSEFSKYFVSRLSFNENSRNNFLKIPGRVIYSLEAKRKFKKLLNDFKPDIIHIHNIYHQISPSILDLARQAKIPVIMHLHDYKLICPNYQLFANGKICEACKPNKYYNCAQKKCFKASLSKSLLATIEMYIHHSILKIYKKNISAFIAPSAFMKKKVVEFAWPEDKINIVINPFSSSLATSEDDVNSNTEENYLLYFGRLSKEKGLETLIKAAAINGDKINLAGDGPEEDNLKKIAKELKVDIEFLGFKNETDLKNIILRAKAIIIPSIWYENMPLSLLESLSLSKLVIASNIGGIPELINHGKNGLLFEAGNENDLAKKIKSLDQIDKSKMKIAAQESVKYFTPLNNLKAIKELYKKTLLK